MTSWNVSEVSGVNLGQSQGLASLAAWIADRLEKRRAVARMQNLDTRMLADIGVERFEIEARVYGKGSGTRQSWSLKPLFAALGQHLRRAQAIRELSALPPHLLADIGVERAMIGDLVDRHLANADAQDRTIAASAAERGATATDRHQTALFRIDPALLADADHSHGRMGWQAEQQTAGANANEKAQRAA